MSWEVIPTDWTVHVVPLDDSKLHTLDLHCHCNPRKEVAERGHVVVIHDAFDGRVVMEQIDSILRDK